MRGGGASGWAAVAALAAFAILVVGLHYGQPASGLFRARVEVAPISGATVARSADPQSTPWAAPEREASGGRQAGEVSRTAIARDSGHGERLAAVARVPPSGVYETATAVPEVEQEEEQADFAAGILPPGTETLEVSEEQGVGEEAPDEPWVAEPSGVIGGQITEEDSRSDPAAGGVVSR